MNSCKRAWGFTLVEVLVALVVLAAVLYAGSVGIRGAARQEEAQELRILAHWVASNAATEITLQPAPENQPWTPPEPREALLYGRTFRVRYSLLEEELPEFLVIEGEPSTARRVVVEVADPATSDTILARLEAPAP
ncbi:MAG: prepilin-type N-terminal cleavage/methylation domain-containing protein [Gammaproteobacteria bacterium]|nr:prepilin-type N-terminal cleavage/methylation domain-containing protein [Gammaproteobacteria bacterium]